MGIEDRDYYREDYAQKNGMQYNSRNGTYSGTARGERIDPTHWREDEIDHDASGISDRRPISRATSSNDDLSHWTKLIAFAVVAIAVALGLRAWREYRAEKEMEAMAAKAIAELRYQQQVAQDAIAKQAAEADRKRREELERVRLQRESLESRQIARQAELAAESRKAAAWERYYRPSAACQRESVSVECANEHIRAKRAFDAQYKG